MNVEKILRNILNSNVKKEKCHDLKYSLISRHVVFSGELTSSRVIDLILFIQKDVSSNMNLLVQWLFSEFCFDKEKMTK